MSNQTGVRGVNSRSLCAALFLIVATILAGCSIRQKPARRVAVADAPKGEIGIIPQPAFVTALDGYFGVNRDTKMIAADQYAIRAAAALNTTLSEKYGFTLEVTDDTSTENAIEFSTDQAGPEEAYFLRIGPESIQIVGTERGMFYGGQSLLQLFPQDFSEEAAIPAAEIRDAPRFRYRGMHLDVSRHFMPVDFVRKFINLISRYKYNYFHWHLTDDQGWRIEIKKYPLLTEIGSKRPQTAEARSYKRHVFVGDKTPAEGYYTQAEIRDIVEYAKARYVTIVPEIDIPGHSSSALAAYPRLGCKENYPYQVKTTWGAFPDIYCPTEFTFQFIQNVLSEVFALFPDSPYIHVGGDEVMTDSWKKSKFVQDLKRVNGFTTEADVQGWFIKRIENFVNSHGRKIIVWDDMLDAGLSPNATVMCWRRFGGAFRSGMNAARAQREVIMTPDDFTYFNHPQSDPPEPLSLGGPTPLIKVYHFEPVPPALNEEDAKYIIGGQGCIWTEFLKKPKEVEYMMFPRAIALAEVLWTKRENKSLSSFSKRLYKELPNLSRYPVVYKTPDPYDLGYPRKVAQNSIPKSSAQTRLDPAKRKPLVVKKGSDGASVRRPGKTN